METRGLEDLRLGRLEDGLRNAPAWFVERIKAIVDDTTRAFESEGIMPTMAFVVCGDGVRVVPKDEYASTGIWRAVTLRTMHYYDSPGIAVVFDGLEVCRDRYAGDFNSLIAEYVAAKRADPTVNLFDMAPETAREILQVWVMGVWGNVAWRVPIHDVRGPGPDAWTCKCIDKSEGYWLRTRMGKTALRCSVWEDANDQPIGVMPPAAGVC